jgi:hypothetical protein
MRQGKISTIGRRVLLCILLANAAWTAYPVFPADEAKDEERRADIIYRCYNQMGEFGAAGVDTCVKAEQSAMRALSLVPSQHREIVQRCTDRLEGAGWQLVKACVDKDIEAAQKKD